LEDETLDLKRMNQAFVDSATPENLQQLDAIAKLGGHNTIEQSVESSFRTMRGWSAEEKALEDDIKSFNLPGRLNRQSIWFDEDDPEPNTEEHDEFDEDDITAMAHGKLEEIREMRNYARLAVWEMPLLASK
jgi:small subunit ribosomal protein S35